MTEVIIDRTLTVDQVRCLRKGTVLVGCTFTTAEDAAVREAEAGRMRSAALAAVDRLDAPTVAALRHRGIALPEFNTRIASRKVLDAVVSDLRATTEWTRTKIRRGVLVLAA